MVTCASKRTRGHSLVELVIVIAILGVLVAIAVPRFQNIRFEAKLATIESTAGLIRAQTAVVYGKARAAQKTWGSDYLDLDATRQIPVHSGYPVAHWNNAMRYVLGLETVGFTGAGIVCNQEWCGRGNQRSLPIDSGTLVTGGRIAKIWPKGYRWQDRCGAYYVNHEDGRRPEIGISVADCR